MGSSHAWESSELGWDDSSKRGQTMCRRSEVRESGPIRRSEGDFPGRDLGKSGRSRPPDGPGSLMSTHAYFEPGPEPVVPPLPPVPVPEPEGLRVPPVPADLLSLAPEVLPRPSECPLLELAPEPLPVPGPVLDPP